MHLRPIFEEDAQSLIPILMDQTVNKTYMLPDFESFDAAKPLFQKLMTLSQDDTRFVRAICKEDAVIGFLNDVETCDGAMELGYVLSPAYHNRGYMTQALGIAIEEVFAKGYHTVITGAFEENKASIRVMQKNGMELMEKVDIIPYRGKEHRCVYYCKKRKDTTLRYKCLLLDHDDTVVQSEATVNYPCFCRFLEKYRPGQTMTKDEYVEGCSKLPFVDMCRERFNFTDEELELEYHFWKAYAKEHIAESYPGIREFLLEYRAMGGKICVSSMSSAETILRDYRTHFGFEPDLIFGWDLPEDKRKPDPYAPNAVMAHYGFAPEDILIVDDMKFAVSMARKSGCPIAFAGWGRKEYPQVCAEMETLCDETFYTIDDLRNYLFQA